MDQEGLTTDSNGNIVTSKGVAPTSITLAQKQKAENDVSHIDCDTIPFMWGWAKNFVLFDNFRQTIVGPSTPNAIAIISGQSGQTQWALHNSQGPVVTYGTAPPVRRRQLCLEQFGQHQCVRARHRRSRSVPGSNLDTSAVKPPFNMDENAANPTLNLTYASLPLSFMGENIEKIIKSDENPAADLLTSRTTSRRSRRSTPR